MAGQNRHHDMNFRPEGNSNPRFQSEPQSRSKFVDVKEVLNKEVRSKRSTDDVNYRIYARGGAQSGSSQSGGSGYIQQPVIPYVQTPINSPNAYRYAGLTSGEAERQRQLDYMMQLQMGAPPSMHPEFNADPSTVPSGLKNPPPTGSRNADDHNEAGSYVDSEIERSEIGIEDNYFLFDSFYKEPESKPNEGLYIYNIQQMNDGFPVKNIIEMEIGNFTIPDVPTESYEPDLFVLRKLYVDFESIRAQQFIHGPPNTKLRTFHFEHGLSTNNTDLPGRFFADPSRYQKYIFTMPVRDIQELRIRFKIPDQFVPFRQDCFGSTTVTSAGGSPGNRRIQTADPHNLTIGDTYDIYIRDFNSTNVALNNFMNSKKGHKLEVIDSTTLQFTADSTGISENLGSALTSLGANPTMIICIAERRIALMIRFRSIVTRITNFIAP